MSKANGLLARRTVDTIGALPLRMNGFTGSIAELNQRNC